jgi:hypothetical protein
VDLEILSPEKSRLGLGLEVFEAVGRVFLPCRHDVEAQLAGGRPQHAGEKGVRSGLIDIACVEEDG